MTGMAPASEEKLDFEDDGMKPTEKLWTITRSEVVAVGDAENSTNPGNLEWQLDLGAEDEPFVRTVRFWLKHVDVPGKKWNGEGGAVAIGRSSAKRFTRALTGGLTSISPGEAVGKQILATIHEDSKGFIRVDRFKTAPAAEAIS